MNLRRRVQWIVSLLGRHALQLMHLPKRPHPAICHGSIRDNNPASQLVGETNMQCNVGTVRQTCVVKKKKKSLDSMSRFVCRGRHSYLLTPNQPLLTKTISVRYNFLCCMTSQTNGSIRACVMNLLLISEPTISIKSNIITSFVI